VRGRYRSVPLEELTEQAKALVAGGVKELILVAQETTLYGVDLYGEKSLHRLLDALNEINGLFWIRILYCYPEEIYEELIDAMRRDEKVCHYLDMPIQHCNDDILRRMGRRTNKKELTAQIEHLRERIPDITLRTTLICGFPGETEEAHEELMQFINDMEFDRLGAFAYSPEEGTPAIDFPDQVSEEQKNIWRDEIMELQEEVSFDKNESMIGRELYAFIEGKVADENAYIGRTYRDAPNVDGYIFINTEEELMTGDIAKVRVTGAYEYDLIGEIIA
jgi:ribosomal protein S12 methylthiotransferase